MSPHCRLNLFFFFVEWITWQGIEQVAKRESPCEWKKGFFWVLTLCRRKIVSLYCACIARQIVWTVLDSFTYYVTQRWNLFFSQNLSAWLLLLRQVFWRRWKSSKPFSLIHVGQFCHYVDGKKRYEQTAGAQKRKRIKKKRRWVTIERETLWCRLLPIKVKNLSVASAVFSSALSNTTWHEQCGIKVVTLVVNRICRCGEGTESNTTYRTSAEHGRNRRRASPRLWYRVMISECSDVVVWTVRSDVVFRWSDVVKRPTLNPCAFALRSFPAINFSLIDDNWFYPPPNHPPPCALIDSRRGRVNTCTC